MKANCGQWLTNRDGALYTPLEIVRVLSANTEFPFVLYDKLERTRHLLPQEYKGGEVTLVKLFFPPRARLIDIERRNRIKKDTLRDKLATVFKNIAVDPETLEIAPDTLQELIDNSYLRMNSGGLVGLGHSGFKYIRVRM